MRLRRNLTFALALLIAGGLVASSCGGGGKSDSVESTEPPPEGRIAFGARQEDGAYGLYVIQPDASGLERLVEEPAPVSLPRWSPDAGRIAYIVGEAGAPGALRVYDFATGATTTVEEGVVTGTAGPAVAWLEDSSGIAFVDASDTGIYVYSFGTGAVGSTAIATNVRALDWSASGRAAFIAGEPSGELALLVAEDGEARELDRRAGLQGARWSPDGGEIAFWALEPDAAPPRRALFVIDGEGGEPDQLAEGEAPAWAADGERIAYSAAAEAGPALDVYVIDAGGGEPRNVTLAVTDDRWPSWSPASDRIVYLATADAQSAFVCVVRLEPEEHDCFDLPGLLPSAPAWSPQ